MESLLTKETVNISSTNSNKDKMLKGVYVDFGEPEKAPPQDVESLKLFFCGKIVAEPTAAILGRNRPCVGPCL